MHPLHPQPAKGLIRLLAWYRLLGGWQWQLLKTQRRQSTGYQTQPHSPHRRVQASPVPNIPGGSLTS